MPGIIVIFTEYYLNVLLIHGIRGKKVMLDFDLARLYQVETRALNQAVQRNLDNGIWTDFRTTLCLSLKMKILKT